MKRITTLLSIFLFAFVLQGQTIIRNGSAILRTYDANQPLNIDDECKVWLDGKDAGQFTLDGTYVDQWSCKGSLAAHVYNTNDDTTRPTYDAATGRVTFISANSTFLRSAAFASVLSQPNTIFVVYKITGNLTDLEVILSSTNNTYYELFYSRDNLFAIEAPIALSISNNTNDNIHVGLFNGASSEYWINGISEASGDVGAKPFNGVTLGHYYGAAFHANMELMEVIIFNADISDVDRDKITGYLANKWSITATTDFKGYVLYEIMWLILLLVPNVRRKEEEFKIAA